MDFLLPLLAGFTLGCIHAFDVDHIVAVTAFASSKPQVKEAAKFGFLWGLGHTATLVVFGVLSIAFRFVIPPLFESVAEIPVGVLLIVIGGWMLRGLFHAKHLHIHKHTHDGVEHVHIHSHRHGEDHHHRHSIFWVGATHGFAGTAAVIVIIPVAVSQSILAAALYLVLFGLGTMVAMSCFALSVGQLAVRMHSKNLLPWFQAISGATSIVVGFFWISEKLL